MVDVRCEWQESAILGEGPLWVVAENALYWLDIIAKKVYRYGVRDRSRASWTFDEQITSLGERRQGGFVASIRDGFAFVDFDAGRVESIVLPEKGLVGNRFNDGKVGPQGRFWAGSMDEGEKQASGVLYRLDADLGLHAMDDGYVITNGPAFSPDGTTLYHTETAGRTIYAFDLSPSGVITDKRVLCSFEADEGCPDGMAVDCEGCLWIGHFGGHRLSRRSPDGELLEVVPMPVPNVTSCAFGGPRLETLFVTTARLFLDEDDLAAYPLAGSLLSFQPGVAGLPAPRFEG